MRVNLNGFAWTHTARGTNIDQLMQHIARNKTEATSYRGRNRLLRVGENADYHFGVVISLKDQRKSCEIADDYSVSVKEIQEGMSQFDFNFFVVQKSTRRGAYQWYESSCSIWSFAAVMNRLYGEVGESNKAWWFDQVRENNSGTIPRAQAAIAKDFYIGKLETALVMRRDDAKAMLEDFKSLSSFSFETHMLSSAGPAWAPLKAVAKTQKMRLSFNKTTPVAGILGAITQTMAKVGFTTGSVSGIDPGGVRRTVDFIENPKVLDYEAFEDIASEESFRLDDIGSSPAIVRLIKYVDDHPEIFLG